MKQLLLVVFFGWVGCMLPPVSQAQNPANELLQKKTESRLQHIIEHSPAITGLAAMDLTTNKTIFSFNADMVFPQASAIKIPILMEVFKQADAEEFALSDKVPVNSSNVVGGTGVLKHLEGNLSMSIRNLCVLMIALSDNSATNILIDLVGMSEINSTLQDLGMVQTRLRRKMMAIEASAQNRENTSTPAEAVQLLQTIYNGEFISKEISSEILSLLKKTSRRESRLAEGVPMDVSIAFKPGGLKGVSTEWAIVLLDERPYAVAVMENYKVKGNSENTVEKLSGILYKYFWRMGNSTRYGVYRDPAMMNQ